MTSKNSDTVQLSETCGVVVGGVISALNASARRKHAEGKVTFGWAFLIVGSILGMWLFGDPGFAVASGILCGIGGAILSGVVNHKRAKKRQNMK
jgi:ABC-type uncharacterized transport system permease subunit